MEDTAFWTRPEGREGSEGSEGSKGSEGGGIAFGDEYKDSVTLFPLCLQCCMAK